MSMSDPIADLLSRIRNAARAGHATLESPSSKLKEAVLNVLKNEGYIREYKINSTDTGQMKLAIELKYSEGKPVFSEISRISKPGRRVYSSSSDLPTVHGGLGIYVMSTSKGIISDHEAREQNVGGEIICKVF